MSKNTTIWEFNKREDKAYCLIFSTFTDSHFRSCDFSFYDTKEECLEEIELIKEVYKNIERPTKKGQKWSYPGPVKNTYECNDNKFFYGWVLVDFKNEKYIIGRDGIMVKVQSQPYPNYYTINNKSNGLYIKDILFRKDNEVAFNYPWDEGEYEGWLRFRWGDGKNAIEGNTPQEIRKIEKKKNYKPKDKYFKKLDPEELKQFEGYDDTLQSEMDKEIENELEKDLMDKYGW